MKLTGTAQKSLVRGMIIFATLLTSSGCSEPIHPFRLMQVSNEDATASHNAENADHIQKQLKQKRAELGTTVKTISAQTTHAEELARECEQRAHP